MPSDGAGPAVATVNFQTNLIRPGGIEKPVSGALAREATGAAIMLGDDKGYWVVTAGVPEVQTPGLPSFKASLSFAASLRPGMHEFIVRAVDPAGHFGPATVRALTTEDVGAPQGHVVVSLSWDTETDLDLHVVDGAGVEVWKRNINSYEAPPPGQAVDPNQWQTGGILDFDSNAECVIDGRRRENVVWKTTAPAGHYVVRVDTFSLCNEASAHWHVQAFLDGRLLGEAKGSSFDVDTYMPHDRGAGVMALEFDVP